MSKYILFSCLVCLASIAGAQTLDQAYRYSILDLQGTARYLGAGGSMGALGADPSVAAMNPAGLGFYRSSELVISPGVGISNIQSSLNGQAATTTDHSKFILGSTGLVMARQPAAAGKLQTVVFSVMANRTADFNQQFAFRGRTGGTITQRWSSLAEGLEPDELDAYETYLAYQTGAIFDADSNLTYTNDFNGAGDYRTLKEQSVIRKGGVTELDLAFAGNLNDKFMFGLTVGIPFLRYEEQKVYREVDDNNEVFDPNTSADFKSLSFGEYVNSSATGVNLKLGVIYRPLQALRIGAAVHTPTWYGVTDGFGSDLTYDFSDPNNAGPYSDEFDGTYEYSLATPWRFIGSLGSVLGRLAFLNADIEYVNYGGSRFNFNQLSNSPSDIFIQNELNKGIEANYQGAVNMRFGGEIALKDFRFRAGFQLLGSPFVGEDAYSKAYSAGLGFRKNNFFMDLGYRFLDQSEGYLPYDPRGSNLQLVDNEYSLSQVNLTIGFRY